MPPTEMTAERRLGLRFARRLSACRDAGDRSRPALLLIAALAIGALMSLAFSVAVGASGASPADVLRDLLSGARVPSVASARDRLVILDIRLPRALLGFVIGASLAVSGAVMQGLFRNPLADPGLAGTAAGASLGAVTMIVLGGGLAAPLVQSAGIYAVPAAAFAGGLVTTSILYWIATRNGRTSVATMLLVGIALAALTMAATGILIYLADDRQLRDVTFWSMGSLAGATWTKLAAAGPVILACLLAMPFVAGDLNALALGEAAAFHMGVALQRLKTIAVLSVAAATGASVAVSGGIGFVGIVVPHLLRMTIGPDHRYLLPAAALLGGSLLTLADIAARMIVPPAEVPIGIVTAIVGSPFLLWIVLRNRAALNL